MVSPGFWVGKYQNDDIARMDKYQIYEENFVCAGFDHLIFCFCSMISVSVLTCWLYIYIALLY